MDQVRSIDEVIVERNGSAGLIRLNRPKAINSLNPPMVAGIASALDAFSNDSAINCIILSGEGPRGLCAGGDVRLIYEARAAAEAARTRFWRDEFPLNYRISHYEKPYIALMDGIVMGGGVGISAHGQHRIVTERTRLAMPETAIGYFPDVGATWLLPKAPGEAGTWLGLTGTTVGAADAIHAGLADYHVHSDRLPELVKALAEMPRDANIGHTIEGFSSTPEAPSILAASRRLVDAAFRFDRVEDIFDALASMDDVFARETLTTLQSRSPTSLKLTLRLLRLGRDSFGLVECLEREFTAGCAVLRGLDFYEGVRAALIDKDRNPQWQPATLAGVTDDDLDPYFSASHAPLFPEHRL